MKKCKVKKNGWITMVTSALLMLFGCHGFQVSTDGAATSTAQLKPSDQLNEKDNPINPKSFKPPIAFIPNRGLKNSHILFYEPGAGHTLYITEEGILIALYHKKTAGRRVGDSKILRNIVRLSFPGANPHPKIVAGAPLPGTVNIFHGNDPAKWKTGLPVFDSVTYQDLYPGVDLSVHGNQGQLEYDLIVRPGSKVSNLRFAYDGVKTLKEMQSGDLQVVLEHGSIHQKKPIIYQEFQGKRHQVDGRFVLLGKDNQGRYEFGFDIAQYDITQPLIIDPVLVFSTYLGGHAGDSGFGVATDNAGNVYVVGETVSDDFPVVASLQPFRGPSVSTIYQDVFVSKFNPSGAQLIYSTYLGGEDNDYAKGIAVDSGGNAYIVGWTQSVKFPLQSAFQLVNRGRGDTFITKLNAAGSALAYSTYLGGSDLDIATDVAVDGIGNAYLTGWTTSTDFPVQAAIQAQNGGWNTHFWDDAFVAKINATPALVFSTYLGGSGIDSAAGIALGPDGDIHIAGQSDSFSDLPGLPPGAIIGGAKDAFMSRLSSDGSTLKYSFFIGGSGSEGAEDIAVDRLGRIFVTGATFSDDFPVWGPGNTNLCIPLISCPFQMTRKGDLDLFITAFEADGIHGLYSTYLGGSSRDEPTAIAVDWSGNAYIVGQTESTDFPTIRALQTTLKGAGLPGFTAKDGFIVKMDNSGTSLDFSTYLGSDGWDNLEAVALGVDGEAVVSGWASDTNFPTAPNPPCISGTDCPFQFNNAGARDAVAFKLKDIPDNDVCGGAQIVTTGTYRGSLLSASPSGSASCGNSASQPDAWYVFTAPSAGTLFVDSCGSNDMGNTDAGVDTVISLHQGCIGTTANEIDCNDDWPSGLVPNACSGTDGGMHRDSASKIHLLAGEQSIIRVSRYGGNPVGGDFLFHVTFQPDSAPPCTGDFDNDGDVDGSDLKVFNAEFGRNNCSTSSPCKGDFDNDGDVDGTDLNKFNLDFGRNDCP
ncbi:MAG: hypothetical protein AXA67_03870 [Methylothermaceae bacteria B42]|nr:MAG: hypothetical protein AXA67_03870 [Methylothermaceae bacteria B42]